MADHLSPEWIDITSSEDCSRGWRVLWNVDTDETIRQPVKGWGAGDDDMPDPPRDIRAAGRVRSSIKLSPAGVVQIIRQSMDHITRQWTMAAMPTDAANQNRPG